MSNAEVKPRPLGAVLVAPPDSVDPFVFIPFDGRSVEMQLITDVPIEVATMATEVADANGATVLGIIVDMTGVS